MDITRKLQITALALTMFAMAYIIYGFALIAYVWILIGFTLWLTEKRYNIWKVSLFWLIAIWIEPISQWMLDIEMDIE